mmetsp:Transcript_147097/g.256693  ORF Transcript_147097/g.256693 Transcript_147097/m.256693 type:complete len:575 (+) Transcript_147097:37-1761(+)
MHTYQHTLKWLLLPLGMTGTLLTGAAEADDAATAIASDDACNGTLQSSFLQMRAASHTSANSHGKAALHRFEDCWYECGNRGGYCSWCGEGNACCRPGWGTDPAECQRAQRLAVSFHKHQCVTLGPEVCGVGHLDRLEASALELAGVRLDMTHQYGRNTDHFPPLVGKCKRESSWFGWSSNDEVGVLSANLRGNGHVNVDFANCWHSGTVNLYVDGRKLASARPGQERKAFVKFRHGSRLELKDEEGDAVMQLNRLAFHCTEGAEMPAKHVQILGLFDTGTNLLEQMVKANLPQVYLEPTAEESNPFIWKHTLSGASAIYKDVSEKLPKGSSTDDVVVLAMVRSPIASIVALRKSPYSLMPCTQDISMEHRMKVALWGGGEKRYADMAKPCIGYVGDTMHNRGPWYNKSIHDGPHIVDVPDLERYRALNFSSTMDVYNQYLLQYRELKEMGRFKDVLIIPYEDLLLDPDVVMQRIAMATGQDLQREEIAMISAPAKDHGAAVGRERALTKLKNREWLNEFHNDPDGLYALCKHLNRYLIKDMVEGSFLQDQSAKVPYTRDCDKMWSVTLEGSNA